MKTLNKNHERIVSILEDGKIHHKDEFRKYMSYDGLRGRVSELNRWGYVIRRVDDMGHPKWNGDYFKCITVPLRESINDIISVSLKPNDEGKVSLVNLGDVHYGNPCFTDRSEEKLDGYIDYILNTDGAYTSLMGDVIESANPHSAFKLKITPQEQYEWVYDKFEPLAEAKKIISILSGNHEDWLFNDKGFDIIKTMSKSFKVPYLGNSGYVGMKVGKQFYTSYLTHPRSAVTKKSSKVRMLEELGNIHNVDIIFCGHIHSIMVEEQTVRKPNFATGLVDDVKQLLVSTGSFLEYGDYAEQARYRPEIMGAPKVKLYSNRFDIHGSK